MIGFGLLTSIISVSLLFYLNSLPPTTVNDYSIRQINYDVATAQSKDGRIVLRSDPIDYTLLNQIWQNEYSQENVVESLNKSRSATVWLDSPTSHTVNGITTSFFSISPEIGVAWTNEDRDLGIWLCWIFAGLGLGLIILAALYY